MSIAPDPGGFYGQRDLDAKIAGLYDMGRTIGRGHFAVVKIAKHVFTGETVAVKVIDKLKLDELSLDHLFHEVFCMKLVQHPNVVRLYDVIDTASKLYLVLELGDGGDLYDFIMRHESGLNEEISKRLFRQIVTAISYCHRLHVVHRDLKPENVVFFEKLGIVKLTDFGFSNKFTPGSTLNTACGSLAYSAPEILLGHPYDAPKVDIWSLGVILYMLVCGSLPFQERNDSETLAKIMDCDYKLPSKLSSECKNLISRLLLRDPDKRISLDEILSDSWLLSSTDCEKFPLERYSEPLISREELSFEDHAEILNRMSEGGLASTEVIQSYLDSDEYNHITATYFLLAERKLKRRHREKFEEFALIQTKLLQQIQTQLIDSESTEAATQPTINSSVETASCHRRFSMILEDEEEEECNINISCNNLKRSRYLLNRISSIITGPLPSMLEEDDQQLEENEEENEEFETFARLAWFRSNIPKSRTQSMSRYFSQEISGSQPNSHRSESSFNINKNYQTTQPANSLRSSLSIPPQPPLVSTAAFRRSSHMIKNLLPMRPLISVKSSPHLFKSSLSPDHSSESGPDVAKPIAVSQDDNLISGPRKRKLMLSSMGASQRSRPGSIIGYPASSSSRVSNSDVRRRRSSISSPIGLDSTFSQRSLSQVMNLRHTPNSGNTIFAPQNQGFGSRRFVDKRRSVPHIMSFTTQNSITQHIPLSLTTTMNHTTTKSNRSTGRSLSDSGTQSDTDSVDASSVSFVPFPVNRITATQRRRGSSEMMVDYTTNIVKTGISTNNRNRVDKSVSAGGSIRLKVKNTNATVSSAHGSVRPHQEQSRSQQDWRNSAPSLLDNLSKAPLRTIVDDQENQFPALIEKDDTEGSDTEVVRDEFAGIMTSSTHRDFCEPIREESYGSVNEKTHHYRQLKRRDDSLMPYANIDRWRRSESAHNRTSSAYYTPFSRASFGSSTPWFISMDEHPESYNPDPETRSVTSIRHPRHRPLRITTETLSSQLSLTSLANSLRTSRHMLNVIRGTFELQNQAQKRHLLKNGGSHDYSETTSNLVEEIQKPRLSTVRSMTLLSSASSSITNAKRLRVPQVIIRSHGPLSTRPNLPGIFPDEFIGVKRERHSIQLAYNESFDENSEKLNYPQSGDQGVDSTSRHTLSSLTTNQGDYSMFINHPNGNTSLRQPAHGDNISAKSFDLTAVTSSNFGLAQQQPLISLTKNNVLLSIESIPRSDQLHQPVSKSCDDSASFLQSNGLKSRCYSTKIKSGPGRFLRLCSLRGRSFSERGANPVHTKSFNSVSNELRPARETHSKSEESVFSQRLHQKKFQCCLIS